MDFAGITRHAAARAIAKATGGKVARRGAAYVVDGGTGSWAVLPHPGSGDSDTVRGGVAVAPPILLDALGTHGAVHAALAAAGATWDEACGMSVTVRTPGLSTARVVSYLNGVANAAPLLAAVLCDRSRWCSATAPDLLDALRQRRDAPLDDVRDLLRGLRGAASVGASADRLAFHALRATIDPVEYAASVHVALGLVARAFVVDTRPGTGWHRFGPGTKWAAVQFFYIMHGLVGPEFAATRALLRARVRAAFPIDHSDRRPLDTWANSAA